MFFFGKFMQGLHILANFYDCSFDFSNEQSLLESCKNIIKKSGLTIVGESQHLFEPHGLTFAILLAESHLSIHTWPEDKNIAFDLYTCNYFADNSKKTRFVYDEIKKILKPNKIDAQFIERLQLNNQ